MSKFTVGQWVYANVIDRLNGQKCLSLGRVASFDATGYLIEIASDVSVIRDYRWCSANQLHDEEMSVSVWARSNNVRILW